MLSQLAIRALHLLPPEMAHRVSIAALKWAPRATIAAPNPPDPRLNINVFGLTFATPLGLAAGYDKDARVWRQLNMLGFSHVEVGTVTPKPQPGNPAPRVFRLPDNQAIINRMGFPGRGQAAVLPHVTDRRKGDGILGINIGRNKDQTDAIADYVSGIQAFGTYADYITINISSPNTPGLRDLQGKAALRDLLIAALETRAAVRPGLPVLVKVAPDLDAASIADIADTVSTTQVNGAGIDGLIVSNTTTARPDTLHGPHVAETGGLSGAPLFDPSLQVLRDFRRAVGPHLPLIGVGGIRSADHVWAKMCAGASLVQIYTALVYAGPGLVRQIDRDLFAMMDQKGIQHISEIIGSDVND